MSPKLGFAKTVVKAEFPCSFVKKLGEIFVVWKDETEQEMIGWGESEKKAWENAVAFLRL